MFTPAKSLHKDMHIEHWMPDKFGHSVLYFHGFPGHHPNNTNKQLSHSLSSSLGLLGMNLLAPHFFGLGNSSGQFSFERTFQNGKDALELLKDSKKVSVIGYSWGGFVGSHVYSLLEENRRGALVLLAPVTQLFSDSELNEAIREWRSEFSDKLRGYPTDEMLKQELIDLFEIYNPLKTLNQDQVKKTSVIHGTEDAVIPRSHSDKFVFESGLLIQNYKLMSGQNHDFENRDLLFQEIVNAISIHS